MTLGIMQPYFFPYLGYFSLIKHTDKWIVLDNVQFIKGGWINRNRIIHQSKEEYRFLTVPLRRMSFDTKIKDTLIDNSQNWQRKILNILVSTYKKSAPFYQDVMPIIKEILNYKTDSISALNIIGLEVICKYLDINFNYDVFSQMNLKIEPVHNAGEWALNISKAMEADKYINPPGGQALFDKQKFKANNINLEFLQIKFTPYEQKKASFIEGLSIIDVMMFNSKERINEMLDNYEVIQ